MSEKRFDVHEYGDFYDNKAVTDDGHKMDEQECADRLNEQAETIEVLRETVRAYVPYEIIEFWREVAISGCPAYNDIREEAKRRIAALEGK